MRTGSPPGRPENVTVKRISPSTVVLTWLSNAEENARYEISYKPVKASYKTVTEVDARQKSIVLDRLLPTALYQVHITTINDEGRSNQSQTIIFDTSQNSANGTTKSSQGLNGTLNARGEEIGIVVVVLLLWVFVILLFFNKWGKIRMLEPYHPEYKQAHVIPTCQLKGSRITLDQMHVSMNALFERERLLSVAHVHRAARPRQNSVFVHGSINATTSAHSFSRKVKSAEDIQSMVFKSAENVASTEM